MKVLHLLSEYIWTGPADPVLRSVVSLRAVGCDAWLATPNGPPHQAWRRVYDGLRGHPRPAYPGMMAERTAGAGVPHLAEIALNRYSGPWGCCTQVRALRRVLIRERFDILHLHLPHDHYIGTLAIAGLGFPFGRRTPGFPRVVLQSHRSRPYATDAFHRFLAGNFVDQMLVSSRSLAREWQAATGSAESFCLPSYVTIDLQRFRPEASKSAGLRVAWGVPADAPVIGLVARMQAHREHDFMLEAFRGVLRQAPAARLVLIGRGEIQDTLRSQVAAAGLAERVLFPGYLREDYPAALSLLSAQVFLVPGSDGGCRAAVEGMACGVPLVVTRRGVLPELVEDGRTGFVIDPGDAEGLAGALLSIVRNPSLGREMSACARSRAEQRHDPIQGARSLLGVYERLCGTTAY